MASELIQHQGGDVDRYSRPEIVNTIRQTVAKGATDAQLQMFLEVCRRTGLDPFLKEIWYVPQSGIIMAGRDGYLRVANENPQFDGMETHVERDEKGIPLKATCTVWRKDRSHPIVCEAWYSEYNKRSPVWVQYPSAMISKVAEVLALKRSFAINGVVSEEELSQEPRATAATMPPEPPAGLPAPEALPTPAETPTDPLGAQLATFLNRAAISASFAELKKVWLKYESEEAWSATLDQYQIEGENYRSIGNAKRCFTALWKATEKMMLESQEGEPA